MQGGSREMETSDSMPGQKKVMAERNGLKSRIDHLENRLEDHLNAAGSRFDEMSEFRGNMQARMSGIEDSVNELKAVVGSQTAKIDQMNRRLAYYGGIIAIIVFLLNFFSPSLTNLIK